VRSAAVLQIVKSLVKVENPATQRSIASRTGTSQATVHRIIKENLELEKISKPFVHKLSPRHISERKTNARKLYENYLAADTWKFVVTLDEAWLYLSDTNKIRAIYYRQKGEKSYTKWLRECKESFGRGFMIVAGYCHNGKLSLVRVEKNVKINSMYFQSKVLTPLFSK